MKTFEIVIDLDLATIGEPNETAPPHIWKISIDDEGQKVMHPMLFADFIESVCEDILPNADPRKVASGIVHHLRCW